MNSIVERLRSLPPDRQEDVARVVLRLTGDEQPAYRLTLEGIADLSAADSAFANGDIATDAEVRAVWAKHGL